MKLRAIVQTNPETGEKVMTLTTDRATMVEEFLVTNPDWKNSTYIEEEILVFASDEMIDSIRDTELRSDIDLIGRLSSSVL